MQAGLSGHARKCGNAPDVKGELTHHGKLLTVSWIAKRRMMAGKTGWSVGTPPNWAVPVCRASRAGCTASMSGEIDSPAPLQKSSWISFTTGLLFLFAGVRDLVAPGFPGMSASTPGSSASSVYMILGLLFFWTGFRARREGEEQEFVIRRGLPAVKSWAAKCSHAPGIIAQHK